ncbi:MAG TPA: DUF1992 domain-containing protein [Anaerolineae bacterium]
MWQDDLIEKKIRDAMARGEFENLPGRGKPQDHRAYFALPEDLRLSFTVLQNAGYLPAEVDLLREIAELEERLTACADEGARTGLRRAIADKRLRLDLLLDARKRRPRPR